ncbi:ribokinase [Chitinimonas sp. BJB300]|uniref:ribokinase n=1 Tax=Chitinimonas sp. BJB300 TaxID=1559339 RepID=UPI000C117E27|nr:ribokinase [Chitinimonas sp. BJB300]PHV11686.1 ribokinase [Chitinimonas sp. BJB300]TSJ88585.1 ribokinase [Chitinimonas sp. BJB300]
MTLKSSRRLVVIGSLNMDLVMRAPRAPEAGETLTGHGFTTHPGGKGANQAVACARLGGNVAMVGRLGDDTFGKALRAGLVAEGVTDSMVSTDAEAASGVAMILVDDEAQNRITLALGANNQLLPEHLDAAAELLDGAALLLLQLEVPIPTVLHAAKLAKQFNCPVLLNPAPAAALPDEIWPLIDYLVPNETETALLCGRPVTDVASAAVAAEVFLAKGVRHVLITMGSKGVFVATAEFSQHLPAFPVKAVDTTGAGDTFIGGFSVGLSEGKSLQDAARLGQRAAALGVTRHGAQSSIPYRIALGT